MTLRKAALGGIAVALIVAACGGGDGDANERPALAVPDTIDHEAAWTIPNEDVLRLLQRCPGPGPECVEGVMEDSGARPAAIDFFRQTQWFMLHHREMGTVDVASIFDPWRANSNSDYALVNGSPAIIYAEDEGWNIAESLQDPEPTSLNNAYPDLNLWGGDNFFESVEESPQGGQAFIFQYSLKDGCHACATGAFQRAALDFEPDGTYVGPRLLDVCKSDFTNDTVSIVTSVADLDVCPIRIAGF